MSKVTPKSAVEALSALAHEHRLAVFRLLVERGPEGLPAGAIADKLGMPASSLTFHVQALARAGLVRQERVSRQIICTADFAVMNALLAFLTEKCCAAASPEIAGCAPTCAPATRRLSRKRT